MKRLKYLLLLALTVGCDDYLEVENPNRLSTENYWQSGEQALAGINAAYQSLIIDGTYMRMLPAMSDNRGDDVRGDSPWGDYVQVGNFTIPTTSAPVHWIWRDHYQMVWRANQVLTFVPEIPAEEIDEDLRSRILGQAHFLRGLAYFNLANLYKQVPLVLELPSDPDKFAVPTASEEDLWNQIYSDFEEAKELLPITYSAVHISPDAPDLNHVGRATKGAAIGMLGKAYLYRQQWAAAAAELRILVEGELSGLYSLVPNYQHNFSPFPEHENNSESLFEVQFATVEQMGGTVNNWYGDPGSDWQQISAQAQTYGPDEFSWADMLPAPGLYAAYKSEQTVDGGNDPRLIASILSYEPESNATTAYGKPWPWINNGAPDRRIYIKKYTNSDFGYPRESLEPTENGRFGGSGINYRVLRYADILLMYAEALNELGQTAEAYKYIQRVRDRVNLPDLATVKPNLTQAQMRDQIAHERYLEFPIEGQRINDLIRWGWFYDADKLAMLKVRDPDFETWTPGQEYLPIPQVELDVNPNLLPNPANLR